MNYERDNLQNNYPTSTYCPYYDQGLYIGSTQSGDTKIAMCCWQDKHIVDKVDFNDPYLLDARQQAKTKIPTVCSTYCRQPNHIANERERSQGEHYWTPGNKIKKLHLEQSLACNLTCISCSSLYSSAWNTNYHLFDSTTPTIRLKKDPESAWEHLDLSEVEHIHFTGGEPLMNHDNLKILEHLDSIGRLSSVSLSYSTNGTIRPSARWIELWSRAHWIRLFFSLDGVGSTFEYTRYPAQWSEVEENIQWFRELTGPCILIEVDAIVGIHNIFNLPEFYAWWKESCQTGNQGDPSQIFVRGIESVSFGGEALNVKYLPDRYRADAESVLQSLSELPGAMGLFGSLCKENSTMWLEYFTKLDRLRNTNWRTALSGPIIKY